MTVRQGEVGALLEDGRARVDLTVTSGGERCSRWPARPSDWHEVAAAAPSSRRALMLSRLHLLRRDGHRTSRRRRRLGPASPAPVTPADTRRRPAARGQGADPIRPPGDHQLDFRLAGDLHRDRRRHPVCSRRRRTSESASSSSGWCPNAPESPRPANRLVVDAVGGARSPGPAASRLAGGVIPAAYVVTLGEPLAAGESHEVELDFTLALGTAG